MAEISASAGNLNDVGADYDDDVKNTPPVKTYKAPPGLQSLRR